MLDVFVGMKDLAVLGVEFAKWAIGLLTGESESLWKKLEGFSWSKIAKSLVANFEGKWNHENLLRRWHFRGWFFGYLIAEAVMMYLSVGAIQLVK
ncbi:hypothetical protein N9Y42_09895, partial [Mariniblastus sp.]|nr:hypothetical protein [Mariniblastus sp.]